jgi:hypothetical protein
MTALLTDMHKLEGTLDANGISSSQFQLKSKYFNSVLEKYGITQAQFDSSVVWYTKNPKEYDDIYTDVMINLNDLQNDIQKGKYHPVDSVELRKMRVLIWNKKGMYHFTKDSTRTHFDFKIKDTSFLYRDVYVLKFKMKIAKEDSCKNQRIIFCLNYWNGKSDSVTQKTYNDNLTRRYTFKLHANKALKIKSISGQLLASSAYKGVFHTSLDSILLLRVYDPKFQDSLRLLVKIADPKEYEILPGNHSKPAKNLKPIRINDNRINVLKK